MPVHRAHAGRRLLVALAAVLALGGGLLVASSVGASLGFPEAVPGAECGPGALPETSYQGRVPKADFDSGRAARGYRCNTELVGHQGRTGGFKVLRYEDSQGNTCGFYDSTLLLPRDVVGNLLSGDGLGVVVLDMNDPTRPRRTANLVTPAMLSPHESLLLSGERGLLVASMGTVTTAPGFLDVYDVRTDCRHPRLLSTTPSAELGHESGLSPDGRTFYAGGAVASLVAVDISDPRRPRTLLTQFGVQYHGLRLSDDGRTMYVAHIGRPGAGGITGGGLRVLDVSDVQDRQPSPKVTVLSELTWPEVSIPQVAEPFTRDGHRYVLEVDEFVDLFSFEGLSDLSRSPVGAARIIDVHDPRHPHVVSNIRLTVHQPSVRTGEQAQDPGAGFPTQGYAAHYCSMPTREDPDIAGCSMILSGLRLFDISDVENPREVGYFNQPATGPTGLGALTGLTVPERVGGYAMSQPAWDVTNDSVWYSDANSGFYNVRLTNGVEDLLPR
jgi:hypothetical protein